MATSGTFGAEVEVAGEAGAIGIKPTPEADLAGVGADTAPVASTGTASPTSTGEDRRLHVGQEGGDGAEES